MSIGFHAGNLQLTTELVCDGFARAVDVEIDLVHHHSPVFQRANPRPQATAERRLGPHLIVDCAKLHAEAIGAALDLGRLGKALRGDFLALPAKLFERFCATFHQHLIGVFAVGKLDALTAQAPLSKPFRIAQARFFAGSIGIQTKHHFAHARLAQRLFKGLRHALHAKKAGNLRVARPP